MQFAIVGVNFCNTELITTNYTQIITVLNLYIRWFKLYLQINMFLSDFKM